MAAEFTPDPGEGTGLDEAIAAYLAACEVEGKTRRTVQAYAETLRRFRAICAAEGPARSGRGLPPGPHLRLPQGRRRRRRLPGHPAPPLP